MTKNILAATLAIAGSAALMLTQEAPAQAAGEATIHGVVKFQGTPPKPTPIDMSADPYCAKSAAGAKAADILVGSGGGLENVVVYVASGVSGQTFQPPADPAVITQKGCMYQPHVLAMQANQKLNIVNDDKTSHNIHPTPINNREWNKSQPPGTPVDGTFTREEISVPVKCNIHPWMKSYIAVLKTPYFSTTDKSGAFEIKNLPPGTYTLTAWQEKLGSKSQTVTIPGAEGKSIEFTFNQ